MTDDRPVRRRNRPTFTDTERYRRILSRMDAPGTSDPAACIEYRGVTNDDGYPCFQRGHYGRMTKHSVARWLWEYLEGPIPPGLTIDHVCVNRRCVNLGHLRLLSHAENARDAASRHWGARDRAVPCPRGHIYMRSETGPRGCRVCQHAAQRAWYLRRSKIARNGETNEW